jgi:hypothetical protein
MKKLLLFLIPNLVMEAAAGTQCFDKAFAHPGNGGLGLTRGQAIELCSGG